MADEQVKSEKLGTLENQPHKGPPAPAEKKLVTVRKGDTRESLAKAMGVSPEDIQGDIKENSPVRVDMFNAMSPYNWMYMGARAVGKVAKGAANLTQKALETGTVDPGEAFEVAMDIGGTGALASKAVGATGSLGMFVGPKAKIGMGQKKALKEAQKAAKEGAKNEDIWNKTKWYQDNLGMWKTEMHLDKANFNFSKAESGKGTLGEMMSGTQAEALYKMYPDLKKIKVEAQDISSGGYYNHDDNLIVVNKEHIRRIRGLLKVGEKEEAKKHMRSLASTIKHELQHAIQRRENWDGGSNPDHAQQTMVYNLSKESNELEGEFYKKHGQMVGAAARLWASNKLNPDTPAEKLLTWAMENEPEMTTKILNAQRDMFLIQQDMKVPSRFENKYGPQSTSQEAYMRNQGEAEARNTEYRDSPKTDPGERRLFPGKTQDIPMDETWAYPKEG